VSGKPARYPRDQQMANAERRAVRDCTSPAKCLECGAYKEQVRFGVWAIPHRPSCRDYEPPEPPPEMPAYCRLCDTYGRHGQPVIHALSCPRHPRNLDRPNYRADQDKARTPARGPLRSPVG